MNKNTITILIFLLIIVVLAFWVISPAYNDITAANAQLNDLKSQKTELENTINKIKSLAKDYDAMKNEVAQINSVLPDDKGLSDAIINMDAIALQNGVAMETVSFPAVAATSASLDQTTLFNTLKLQVNATASSYESFKNFITAIEQNLRIMDVRNLKFSQSGQDNEYSLTVDLDTYYKK